ncbi:hypothetical protein V1478_007276 [Vespula squamosa]|uniref:Uncharacterized protein n=1 Tax=Vespula squamosa TaxID=30214 RepID=A0ABD2B2S6_VESSQ
MHVPLFDKQQMMEDDQNGFPIAVIKVTRIPLPEAWNIRDIFDRTLQISLHSNWDKIENTIILDGFEHFGKYRDAQCGFREVGQSGLAQLQRRCLFRRIICLVCVTITDSLPDDSNTAGAIVPQSILVGILLVYSPRDFAKTGSSERTEAAFHPSEFSKTLFAYYHIQNEVCTSEK